MKLIFLNGKFAGKKLSFVADDFTSYVSKKLFDVVYVRFVLHSVDIESEIETIKKTYGNLKKNGLFLIEVRSKKDPMFLKSTKISDDEGITDHYRRFVDMSKLIENLTDNGFEIVEFKESNGLAVYGAEDPVVIRVVARKTV